MKLSLYPCAALIALIAPLATAAADPPLVERARLELQPPGRPFKKLEIENPLGDVRVEGHDKATIEIETRKQGPTEEALDRLHVTLTPHPDGTVRLTTTADGGREVRQLGRGAVKLDLIVRAPRDARIEAASGSGALEIHNMDNGGDLDTATGRIQVRNVSGELSTHSVSGPTQLTQVFGSVDAETLSSQIDLDSIGGEKLVASANDGKIAGRRVRSRHVELTTVNGMIVLEGEAPLRGRMIIASMRGDINVRVRSNGAIVVRARAARVDLGSRAGADPAGWLGRVAVREAYERGALLDRDEIARRQRQLRVHRVAIRLPRPGESALGWAAWTAPCRRVYASTPTRWWSMSAARSGSRSSTTATRCRSSITT